MTNETNPMILEGRIANLEDENKHLLEKIANLTLENQKAKSQSLAAYSEYTALWTKAVTYKSLMERDIWVDTSVKMPNECETVWLWNGIDVSSGYLKDNIFYSDKTDEPIEHVEICPIIKWKKYKPSAPNS